MPDELNREFCALFPLVQANKIFSQEKFAIPPKRTSFNSHSPARAIALKGHGGASGQGLQHCDRHTPGGCFSH
ncbi:protein of unknown function [Pseudomonas sp. JV241A]|nr:protein of unknown function [Pseudomonas sp. JV241A]